MNTVGVQRYQLAIQLHMFDSQQNPQGLPPAYVNHPFHGTQPARATRRNILINGADVAPAAGPYVIAPGTLTPVQQAALQNFPHVRVGS